MPEIARALPAMTPGMAFEATLPEFQRRLNRICENWIFACLVAMAIRHYVVEAFTIPTASMEPMLYGEKSFLDGDHVVVDKLLCHFRAPRRWDVTVFQYPEPELEHGSGSQPAVDADGNPIGSWPLQPLMYRNFVKRLVGMPGDTFYIANGSYHLRQADGSYRIPEKPAAIQEALWQDVYQVGAQPGYVPWQPAAAVAMQGVQIDFTLGHDAVAFTQPFRNLYLKAGSAGVQRLPDGGITYVAVSMLAPQFAVDGQVGNIWDLDQWAVYRRTLEDLDSQSYSTNLAVADREWVGDVRIQATVTGVQGEPALILRQGTKQGVRLVLSAAGWRLEGLDGLQRPLASGSEALIGHCIALTHLNDRCLVACDGRELCSIAVPEADPNLQRTTFSVTGSGSLELRQLTIQRSLHYTANALLMDETTELRNRKSKLAESVDPVDQNAQAAAIRDISRVRRQLGAPAGWCGAWADSPQHAATIPAGCYLMLGDNSPTSLDGRFWGLVPQENLRGRALAVVLPFTRWHWVR